jgi:hypothetical protein
MKACGLARVDKLVISFMKKGRREAERDDGKEEYRKRVRERETFIVSSVGCFILCPLYIHIFLGGSLVIFMSKRVLHGKEFGRH